MDSGKLERGSYVFIGTCQRWLEAEMSESLPLESEQDELERVHVDRIADEFFGGFDAVADIDARRSRSSARPASARHTPTTRGPSSSGEALRRRRLRGRHRRRPGDDGGGQPRAPRRPAACRSASTSSSRTSRAPNAYLDIVAHVPLLLRAQDDVRQVRRRLRHPARRLRHARRAVRGAHADPDRQGAATSPSSCSAPGTGPACFSGCASRRYARR